MNVSQSLRGNAPVRQAPGSHSGRCTHWLPRVDGAPLSDCETTHLPSVEVPRVTNAQGDAHAMPDQQPAQPQPIRPDDVDVLPEGLTPRILVLEAFAAEEQRQRYAIDAYRYARASLNATVDHLRETFRFRSEAAVRASLRASVARDELLTLCRDLAAH